MKHLRDGALGLLIGAGLLLAAEIGLRLLGIGPPAGGQHLSRGFDPNAAYFTESEKFPGMWQTALWGRSTPMENLVPAKGDRKRVAIFGGSNSGLFGIRFLEDPLNLLAGAAEYEVINLGRSGYGSERVAIITRQALETIEPDIVVIYCGHNEFIERGFQMDLEGQWSSEGVKALAGLATKTHLFNTLASVMAPSPNSSEGVALRRHASEPEDWRFEYLKFARLTFEETLQYYEAYRQNLERMVRASLDRGLRVVLCTVVHNRLSVPWVTSVPASMGAEEAEQVSELLERAEGLLPGSLLPLVRGELNERVYMNDWDEGWRSAGLQTPMEHAALEELLGRRPSMGVLENADPRFPAKKYWGTRVMPLLESLERLHARDPSDQEREQLDRAAQLFAQVLELCPDHPRALFLLGLLEYFRGAEKEVVIPLLEAAGDYDRASRRGSGTTNRIVRELAEQYPEVQLFDADELFCERMPMGLVGWEWMLDECHLSEGARKVLMLDLARAILGRSEGVEGTERGR